MNKYKYVIVCPRNNRGGSTVLQNLCRSLSDAGYESSIFISNGLTVGKSKYPFRRQIEKYIVPYSNVLKYKTLTICRKYRLLKNIVDNNYEYLSADLSGIQIKMTPVIDSNTVVVYPDLVYGNPLNAKNIVRYFLYYNRFSNDDNAYGDDDLFICYRKQFNDWKLNPNGYELQTSYFDLDLYKRTNFGERHGTCYIIRKGKNRADLPISFDGPIIDDMPEDKKVSIFNSCERCISYDTQTAYSSIAAMCGCLSIVVPEIGKGRNDYLTDDDVVYGVAYGFSDDEIAYAMNTANRVKELYEKQNAKGIEEVKKFVNICEEYFG